MSFKLIWIFLLILQVLVTSFPINGHYDVNGEGVDQKPGNTSPEKHKYGDTSDSRDEKVISVRITSSVAVGRGREKSTFQPSSFHKYEHEIKEHPSVGASINEGLHSLSAKTIKANEHLSSSPPNPLGANVEFIKQLNAKKESRDNADLGSPFLIPHGQQPNEKQSSPDKAPERINEYNEDLHDVPIARKVPSSSDVNHFYEQKHNRVYKHTDVNTASGIYGQNNLRKAPQSEASANYGLRIDMDNYKNAANETGQVEVKSQDEENINTFVSQNNNYRTDDSIAESSLKSVEFAKSTVAYSPSTNYIHNLSNRPLNEEQNDPRLTTVSFNIVHDAMRLTNDNRHSEPYVTSSQIIPNQQEFYAPPKIYSKPSQVYSEPSKFYSEPAKFYSEPSKIYSEPAKVYSEPAKIYSEPAKFYSEPASLHLDHNIPNIRPTVPPNYSTWQRQLPGQIGSITVNTTPVTGLTNGYQGNTQMGHQPERNYAIDEKGNTDSRNQGVQDSNTEKCKEDNCKVGYVVEGRQYKKYRVEERTSDGFIVGEYGVVRNEDGALRGVRYTADSDASPSLIHDALMKFLQLK